jgi:hypothetical protein
MIKAKGKRSFSAALCETNNLVGAIMKVLLSLIALAVADAVVVYSASVKETKEMDIPPSAAQTSKDLFHVAPLCKDDQPDHSAGHSAPLVHFDAPLHIADHKPQLK